MKYGVWYGTALWLVILKSLEVKPFSELDWMMVIIFFVWPLLPAIQKFASDTFRKLLLHAK